MLKFLLGTVAIMPSMYVLNKYGLNVIDQPFDFIVTIVFLAIANGIMHSDLR